jgi:hypothetical protein
MTATTATTAPTFQLGIRQREIWETLTDAQRAVANASTARTASAALKEAQASPANPTTENTTTKENTVTENTTAKKTAAKAPAKKAAAAKITTEGRAYSVPKGYEVKWQHGGHDLLKKADSAVQGPAWFTACNAHGDLHEAANAKEAEGFGVLKVRSTWCKGDHKPAAKKAPAKAAAKKAAPAKVTKAGAVTKEGKRTSGVKKAAAKTAAKK